MFMKNNKYKKFKKAIWAGASTGVVTGLILMGTTNAALADTVDNVNSSVPTFNKEIKVSPMHMMGHWKSAKRAGNLATSLGLDPNEVKTELKSGKGLKQILQEHGIVPQELEKAFVGRKSQAKRMWKHNLPH